ncbi:hypothetical protein F0562_031797 [Nyssa sinensis]|uniref:Exocyst subunit Exo70 family protein n=1 Tax=Nyssa sinensis TaxID=561372 RepID=A0A5J5AVG8_9ASTE|nr:hypothetical protein F0562_031797 [Nyssa sinensis]
MTEESIEKAETIITKWDTNGSSYTKFIYLFQENRREAEEFIKCVQDLRRAMHFLVSTNSSSNKLVLAQNLMQTAMKRLEREFYQILSANRQYLDPESVSSGSSRMSGLSRSRSNNSNKEDDVRSDDEAQMAGESISEAERLSELAMSDLKSIADCMISSGYGKECTKIYRIIRKSIIEEELYHLVKLQALNSLVKLGDSVRTILSEFESSIQKNSSKILIPGGGIHPLTKSVMDYISLLADCSGVLTDIVADSTSASQSPLPESYFDSPNADESPTSGVSVRLAWIILVLLCKLDSKAELYKDIALSYLFLANNLQFVVEKVRTTNVKYLLGDHWISKHEKKVKQYAANYEAMAWTTVFSSLPENSTAAMLSPETGEGMFQGISTWLSKRRTRKQTSWQVPDGKLRDEIKVSIAQKLVPAYQEFYDTYLVTPRGEENLEVLVRFSPDNLGNYLSDLFHGTAVSVSWSSLRSSSSHSRVSWCLP